MKVLKFAIEFAKSSWRRWLEVFFEGRARMTESIFAMILILWGAYLLLPARLRSTDIYGPVYRLLLPEVIIGLVVSGVGLVFMHSILCGYDRWRGRYCFLSGFMFAALWGVYLVAGRASVGLILMPFFAFSCALLYLRPYLILFFRNYLRGAEATTNGELDRLINRSGDGSRDLYAGDKEPRIVGSAS